ATCLRRLAMVSAEIVLALRACASVRPAAVWSRNPRWRARVVIRSSRSAVVPGIWVTASVVFIGTPYERLRTLSVLCARDLPDTSRRYDVRHVDRCRTPDGRSD